MDTITQAALGAAVGQACFSKTLGRRANWYGALAGLTPDLDVLARFAGEWESLAFHRGPTHALWFGPVFGTLLGWATWRYYRRKAERAPPDNPVEVGPLRAWIGLWILGLLTHPLLDVFTTYGTQLLAPFDDTRFSLYGVGIIDPFYTVPLFIALGIGRFSRHRPKRAMTAAMLALGLTTGYLAYGVSQHNAAKDRAAVSLAAENISFSRLDAYPTFLQPWLRRVVARDKKAVYVAYTSSLSDRPIRWHRVEHHLSDARVQGLLATQHGVLFNWFANGQLVGRLSSADKGVVEIDDFRYGYVTQPSVGLWGIRGRVSPGGKTVSDVRRTRRRPHDLGKALDGFKRALWGQE